MNEYKGIKVGDIITAYHKGYYFLVEIKDRGKNVNPLFRYKKVADFNGKQCKSNKILECDAAFCEVAYKHMKDDIEQKKTEIVNLEKLVDLYY